MNSAGKHQNEHGNAVAPSGLPARPALWTVLAVLVYAAFVHAADTFATFSYQTPFDWRVLRWVLWRGETLFVPSGNGVLPMPLPGFQLFKFVAWFTIPLLFCLRRFDHKYFDIKRFRPSDWLVLAAVGGAGVLAMAVVSVVPSLRGDYPSFREAASADKWRYVGHMLMYTVSWLVGWEFLHRYALLTTLRMRWPRVGWLLIPLLEGAYHLVKHPLEAAAMVAFSLFATGWWGLRRRNALAPFLAHLLIELELLVFMTFV